MNSRFLYPSISLLLWNEEKGSYRNAKCLESYPGDFLKKKILPEVPQKIESCVKTQEPRMGKQTLAKY